MIDLFEFLQKENELVADAPIRYGDVFASTNHILEYFGQCFSANDEKAHLSTLFILEVQRSLYLSAVSALRRQGTQMYHMFRDALESEVLACYALCQPDKQKFFDVKDGVLTPKETLPDEGGYKWIEGKFPFWSRWIKSHKDAGNAKFTHSNILSVFRNLSDGEEELEPRFFDLSDKEVKTYLWMIGDTAIGCMKFYERVLHDYPLCTVKPYFSEKVDSLFLESERIKEHLKKGFNPEVLKKSKERL